MGWHVNLCLEKMTYCKHCSLKIRMKWKIFSDKCDKKTKEKHSLKIKEQMDNKN